MKRYIFLCLLLLLVAFPFSAFAKTSISTEFHSALEDHLRNEVSYYDENSLTILDEFTTEGVVSKVEGDEIVEYKSNFTIALVEFQQKRDGFIYFDKSELHIWDNDNKEFLSYSNIVKNEQAMDFFSSYIQTLHKEMQAGSLLIFMLMLAVVILFPLSIILFWAPSRSSATTNPFYYSESS